MMHHSLLTKIPIFIKKEKRKRKTKSWKSEKYGSLNVVVKLMASSLLSNSRKGSVAAWVGQGWRPGDNRPHSSSEQHLNQTREVIGSFLASCLVYTRALRSYIGIFLVGFMHPSIFIEKISALIPVFDSTRWTVASNWIRLACIDFFLCIDSCSSSTLLKEIKRQNMKLLNGGKGLDPTGLY